YSPPQFFPGAANGGPDSLPQAIPHLWKGIVENPAPTAEARAAWERAIDLARAQLPGASFEMWFTEVRPLALAGETLRLAVPTEFVRNRLATRHMDLITRAVREATGERLQVELVVDAEARRPRAAPHPTDRAPTRAEAERPVPSPPGQEFPERYTFDSFVLGPSNRFAHAAAMAVSEAPPATAYNPLFIYGGVGLGKTHLLYAIANYTMRLNAEVRAKYVTSERFITEFIRAVREGQGYQFQRRYRNVDVLLVDDIQFLARAEETQTEFFHTFNDLHRAGHQIVIASDRPPQELSGLEDRLRSRFRSGLCVDVQPPDLETRLAILQMKAERDGLQVADTVLHFIAQKFDSNIRELEGALVRVAAFAKLSAMPLDLPAAERALEDLIPQTGQDIPADSILQETATYFGLRREDLYSKSRSRPLTNARHIAMYLLRELTGLSLIKIGELFDRDHTTALHGIKRIEGLMPARDVTYRQVQELTKLIRESSRGNR
ncbi:MAG TPA: chromosomal replication initiator protein DnaA, partial [Actinomycetota bacterium]|nr:chromosomal replication initiator protein DnaA [Actinomycetota bacterium]